MGHPMFDIHGIAHSQKEFNFSPKKKGREFFLEKWIGLRTHTCMCLFLCICVCFASTKRGRICY
jgi:hypothetical protein